MWTKWWRERTLTRGGSVESTRGEAAPLAGECQDQSQGQGLQEKDLPVSSMPQNKLIKGCYSRVYRPRHRRGLHQNRTEKCQSSAGDQERLPWTLKRNAVDIELSKVNWNAESCYYWHCLRRRDLMGYGLWIIAAVYLGPFHTTLIVRTSPALILLSVDSRNDNQ